MSKKVLIALPPAMLEQVDFIAQCEHRTRSDLIREALRRYLDNFRRTQGQHLAVSSMEVSQSFNPPKPTLIIEEVAPTAPVKVTEPTPETVVETTPEPSSPEPEDPYAAPVLTRAGFEF